MAAATAHTKWPDVGDVPQWLKSWLDKYFRLADTQGDEASNREFATQFAENGVQHGLGAPLQGREGMTLCSMSVLQSEAEQKTLAKAIAKSRPGGWKHLDWRKHEVVQVFTARKDYSDVLMQGKITAIFKNKQELSAEFTAQIVFEDVSAAEPKALLYKTWADTAPWVKAMEANK
ncbi:uncharacterized protein Z520_07191 [Fonsecaea multimorphosa CBS 102226]|uniref:SnoaL-like domain-containing protein n=1 Tax=Fonsecaea multimorphosa CBS 102226 TaxID=1442371 RepID=A0A0D2JUA6_9EURO|nr:uncharacterized protein Z520_07191 [Fonsecaea multimorphosa CBS 102226]KIX97077.1 hypothetical protein Z520_07191 [Fonsecaea multimorphosa CBS 102226]OAL22853.1 hypothetical protein AYO22_06761 [Fonsecaea multimorphosa]